ncbi:MAG: biotin--[acetyl-CoA-carboxylase] ligase [Acidimicrobiia bacterium]|nr:biotin--[acetyl-CoA-carboxylase] ligase [Acidimicrobiia bacterium]NNC75556.1 biotin--[acetyl-CoA-carboxylase] ligase [Acidimicrobiia bacterium]
MQVVHLDEVASTQDEARRRHTDEPVLVTASAQRAGRGRSGASWLNAPRAVAASLAFAPASLHKAWTALTRPVLTLAAGVAVADAIGGLGLKWPNDLMRGDVKVGGLLTEAFDEVVVVGLGVNLWWPAAPDGMGGVFGADPGIEMIRSMPRQWADSVVDAARSGPSAWDRDRYRKLSVTLNRAVRWEGADSGQGMAVDVGPNGALVVETEGGVVELTSGAVSHVRPTEA